MTDPQKTGYLVLARKYRPQHFDQLIGQDALVRTLKNAIQNNRIAHAYMLTGIRGTGKTTTARIIARALNYTGPDGKAGPTTGPTDDCAVCRSIAEDRCPDVLEMDAASRTGVEDIREITDGVRYAPVTARYKIYIIDEVHMLSKNAFNALLKTLEEPPPHVIFIFATTEIRKVPVTVLSRCQRFDLKRVDAPVLQDYYKKIAAQEKAEIDDEALGLIARAADGSVRDGLSLLDQAMALGEEGIITGEKVRGMLGLADRTQILDLLDYALKGDCAQALDLMSALYKNGADPVVVLQDMLDFVHVLTKLRAVPGKTEAQSMLSRETQDRAAAMARELSMPVLGRAWQLLLKGLGEAMAAPNPQAAAEMILIRLAYAADLPDPADLLRRIKKGENIAPSASGSYAPSSRTPEPVARAVSGGAMQPAPAFHEDPQAGQNIQITSLAGIEEALRAAGHLQLAGEVYYEIHLVKLEQGRLEIRPRENARAALSSELAKTLTSLTGQRWIVSISGAAGAPTLDEQKKAAAAAVVAQAKENPVVRNVLALFPGTDVKIKN